MAKEEKLAEVFVVEGLPFCDDANVELALSKASVSLLKLLAIAAYNARKADKMSRVNYHKFMQQIKAEAERRLHAP